MSLHSLFLRYISMSNSKRLDALLRHVNNVQDNCLRLGELLIEKGDEELGRKLIVNGRIHDKSKFEGMEWEYFHAEVKEDKPELFRAAWLQHVKTNPHHPEYWVGGIKEMSDVYIAEMVCDWYARSMEFGDNIWDWVKDKASEKYGFTTNTAVYRQIKLYLDMVLEPAFK